MKHAPLKLKTYIHDVVTPISSAEDQPEDVMIANIARACFPDLYERRLSETQEDRQSILAVLPIFYCESFSELSTLPGTPPVACASCLLLRCPDCVDCLRCPNVSGVPVLLRLFTRR